MRSWFADIGTAWLFAKRELRGGLKGFRVFVACLALGVGAIASVGSLSDMLQTGLAAQSLAVLGGDAEVVLTQRDLTQREITWLESQGTVSRVKELRAMARGLNSDVRNLVELKSVDERYPLYGELTFEDDTTLQDATRNKGGVWGAAVEPKLLPRLGIGPGDLIRLGDIDVEVRALIALEPDRVSNGFSFAPRIFISPTALNETGLVTFGSQISRKYRIQLPEGTDGAVWMASAAEALDEDAAERLRGPEDGTRGAEQFIERVSLFLTLVGLTTLVIGGVGVGNAIKAFLDGKAQDIAIYKCLGATGALIFQSFFIQVLAIASIGLLIGIIAGILIPMAVVALFGALLPFPAEITVYPLPLLMAAVDGLLVTIAFAIWPLARARDVKPAALFRDMLTPQKSWPRLPYVIATAITVFILVILAVFITPYQQFALIFLAGASVTFLLLRLEAALMVRFAKALGRPKSPGLRLALTNLYRPGAPTVSVVMSIGLGLTLIVAVAMIEGNISQQIEEELPDAAPPFFMFDIRRDQAEPFDALVEGIPGVQSLTRQPIVRATVTEINGVVPNPEDVAPEARWVLERERNITYRVDQPDNATIIDGEWWPADYTGEPLISISTELQQGLNLGVGDTVTFSIVGRPITAEVANVRRIDVTQGGTTFSVIFSPGPLDRAPQQNLALIRVDQDAEERVHKAVTDEFPNISIIWVREAMAALITLLADIAVAVQSTGAVTILAGILVLSGAMASGHRHRVYDSVILKVLGATRRRILTAYLIEYAILGFGTALLAALIGTVGAYLIITQGMEATWSFLPMTLASTIIIATLFMVILGFFGIWRALGQKAAPVLRTE